MKPLVSIIAPCFNGERYIARFLDSILHQTYPNIELILVNDGSTDRTEKIVESYIESFEKENKKLHYLYQDNAGQAAALNNGLKHFSGDYLSWLDSDDEILAEFIEKKVLYLENNRSCMYCYGKAIEVNENDPDHIVRTYGNRNRFGRYDFFEDVIFFKNVFFSGYMARVEAFDKVISNREIYCGAGGQNAQILLPMSWYYGEPGYVEDSIYKYYVHNDSHSHSQNTSEKIIAQLHRYEKILTSTIEGIEDEDARKYLEIIRKHYAKLRFGNALDTKSASLIRRYYKELKQENANGFRDFMLYIKYTQKCIRHISLKRFFIKQ